MAILTLSYSAKANSAPSQSGWNSFDVDFEGIYTFTLADFTTDTTPAYEDPEGDDFESIQIIRLPSTGTLMLSSVAVVADDIVTSTQLTDGDLTYIPDVDTDGYEDGDMEFYVSDEGSNSFGEETGSVTFNVGADSANNSAPDAVGILTITIDSESTYTFTEENFTTETTPTYNDPDGDDAESIKITTLTVDGILYLSNEEVYSNDEITLYDISLGKLTYVAEATTEDYIEDFNFSISDAGSGEFLSGGIITMDVSEYVNQDPTVEDVDVEVAEGAVYTFTAENFTDGYNDPEGDIAIAVRFTSLPSTGLITLDSVAVTVLQEIDLDDIENGLLIYTQDTFTGGTSVEFNFDVEDAEGNWSE